MKYIIINEDKFTQKRNTKKKNKQRGSWKTIALYKNIFDYNCD